MEHVEGHHLDAKLSAYTRDRLETISIKGDDVIKVKYFGYDFGEKTYLLNMKILQEDIEFQKCVLDELRVMAYEGINADYISGLIQMMNTHHLWHRACSFMSCSNRNSCRGSLSQKFEILSQVCPLDVMELEIREQALITSTMYEAYSAAPLHLLVEKLWPGTDSAIWDDAVASSELDWSTTTNSHRQSLSLFQLCSMVVKVDAKHQSVIVLEEAKRKSDILLSYSFLPFKLSD